jgi:glycosyltransferase involved in cell wall biosynthesis
LDFVRVAAKVAQEETDVHFLLVGDGALRPNIESEVRRHGLEGRLLLLGWRRDIPEILQDTDVLVLTSLWEGLPRVLPQAMAVGVPAVVTEVDGSPEAIVDGVNGFLVRPKDVETMAQRIIQLIRDPDLRRKMGEEGRKRVGEFDIREMVRKQEEFYSELLETKLGRKLWQEDPRREVRA